MQIRRNTIRLRLEKFFLLYLTDLLVWKEEATVLLLTSWHKDFIRIPRTKRNDFADKRTHSSTFLLLYATKLKGKRVERFLVSTKRTRSRGSSTLLLLLLLVLLLLLLVLIALTRSSPLNALFFPFSEKKRTDENDRTKRRKEETMKKWIFEAPAIVVLLFNVRTFLFYRYYFAKRYIYIYIS